MLSIWQAVYGLRTHRFSNAERAAVYRAIAERRDMRHFSGGKVAPELLTRLLQDAVAHQAPKRADHVETLLLPPHTKPLV